MLSCPVFDAAVDDIKTLASKENGFYACSADAQVFIVNTKRDAAATASAMND